MTWGRVLLVVFTAGALCCSRRAEIREDPERTLDDSNDLKPPEAGVPTVAEGGLSGDDAGVCLARPNGDCRGDNDFVCGFDVLLEDLVATCQERSGCRANDWLAVDLSDDGCAVRVGMTQYEPDFTACLVETLRTFRCPCTAQTFDFFLGVGNDGCGNGAGGAIH